MEPLTALALALGSAWGSGLNLYATVLILGGLDAMGAVTLPDNLQVLASPWVLAAAALMYFIEFFADKIPGLDSIWDMIHTFIRIPAGALMAAGALGGMDFLSPEMQTVAGLVGGGAIAAGTHAAKAGTRAVVNTSPEPFSNWALSIVEDVMVFGGMALALFNPVAFLIGLALFALLLAWLLPKIWRGIMRFFGGYREPESWRRPPGGFGFRGAGAGPSGPPARADGGDADFFDKP